MLMQNIFLNFDILTSLFFVYMFSKFLSKISHLKLILMIRYKRLLRPASILASKSSVGNAKITSWNAGPTFV